MKWTRVLLFSFLVLCVAVWIGESWFQPRSEMGLASQWTRRWITERKSTLGSFTTLNQVFTYVKQEHPTLGWNPMPPDRILDLVLSDNTTELAEYADAVTMARVDLVEKQEEWNPADLILWNEGSFANVAYISLYHPMPEIRAMFQTDLQRMQAILLDYMLQHSGNPPPTLRATSRWSLLYSVMIHAQMQWISWRGSIGRYANATEMETEKNRIYALYDTLEEHERRIQPTVMFFWWLCMNPKKVVL